ncbi:hypothetical protein FS749_011761 [Ceratobasidium sp. UAMH 11750]|nr:hypothetical protein FS749_011761 [Ceratobasidium sp. UAMH 11750]
MEALRRGASLAPQQAATAKSSRQMSTVAAMTTDVVSANLASQPPPPPPRAPSPTSRPNAPRLAPTGLPFYTHTDAHTSAGLPAVPLANVQYFRYGYSTPNAPEEANMAISRMVSNLNSPPGGRWQGVVGFDMEWTVPVTKGKTRTGLVQMFLQNSRYITIQDTPYPQSSLKNNYILGSNRFSHNSQSRG